MVAISDMTVGMWCWRRPQYLRRTLASWAQVDGVRDLRAITIALEPSERKPDMLAVIDHARDEYGLPLVVRHNPELLGVLVNPVVSGSAILDEDPGAKFLIAMDEDMLLSDEEGEEVEEMDDLILSGEEGWGTWDSDEGEKEVGLAAPGSGGAPADVASFRVSLPDPGARSHTPPHCGCFSGTLGLFR